MYVNSTGRIVKRARIKEWITVYEDKDGNQVVIKGFDRPTKHRVFRVSAKPGRRKFKAVSAKWNEKELVFVAKKSKSKKKKEENELSEEEIAELEELEDLDDLDDDEDVEDDEDVDEDEDSDDDEDEDDEDSDDEDEDEDDSDEDDEDDESDDGDEDEDDEEVDDDEDDEDEEDEDEEPPAKSKKSKKKSSKKKGKSRASSDGKVGTQEVAEHCGIDGRTLRMVLRKHNIAKDPDTKRYEWSSLNHPEVKKIVKLVKERGEGKKVKQESLDNLKKGRTKKSKSKAKKGSKKSTSKKSTKKKGSKKTKR